MVPCTHSPEFVLVYSYFLYQGLQRTLLLYQGSPHVLQQRLGSTPNLYGTFKFPLGCSSHLLGLQFLAQ